MIYQIFLDQIKEHLSAHFTDADIVIQKIRKNNDLILDALSIIEPGKNIAPTIYLNSYYKDLKSGKLQFHEIVDHIIQFHKSYSPNMNVAMDFFLDFDSLKDHIVFRIVNFSMNQQLLKEIPHIPYLDLAICFYYLYGENEQEQGTILIRNEHLKLWKVNDQTIYELARENTPKLLPASVSDMQTILKQLRSAEPMISLDIEEPLDNNSQMYILSNYKNLFGASCILYEDLLRQISKNLQSSFMIIPSSIHEVILVRCHDRSLVSNFSKLVQSINHTELQVDEILSDHVYFYDSKSCTLTM